MVQEKVRPKPNGQVSTKAASSGVFRIGRDCTVNRPKSSLLGLEFTQHLSIRLVNGTPQHVGEEFGNRDTAVSGNQLRLADDSPINLHGYVVSFARLGSATLLHLSRLRSR